MDPAKKMAGKLDCRADEIAARASQVVLRIKKSLPIITLIKYLYIDILFTEFICASTQKINLDT